MRAVNIQPNTVSTRISTQPVAVEPLREDRDDQERRHDQQEVDDLEDDLLGETAEVRRRRAHERRDHRRRRRHDERDDEGPLQAVHGLRVGVVAGAVGAERMLGRGRRAQVGEVDVEVGVGGEQRAEQGEQDQQGQDGQPDHRAPVPQEPAQVEPSPADARSARAPSPDLARHRRHVVDQRARGRGCSAITSRSPAPGDRGPPRRGRPGSRRPRSSGRRTRRRRPRRARRSC